MAKLPGLPGAIKAGRRLIKGTKGGGQSARTYAVKGRKDAKVTVFGKGSRSAGSTEGA